MSYDGATGVPNTNELPRQFPKPGEKPITMAVIARAAAVSQGAVSSLLNDRDYGIRVSEKTRERVFRVCREMGYIPNDLRAVVRMYPHLGEICVLCAASLGNVTTHPFYSRVIAAAMSASPFPSKAIQLSHFDTMQDYMANPETLPHAVTMGVVTKFIMLGQPNQSLLHMLVRRGFPAVTLDSSVMLAGVTSITPDYRAASRLAIEHLAGLGHKRIAIFAGPFGATEPNLLELNRGLKEGLDAANLPLDDQSIVYGEMNFRTGYDAVDGLVARDSKVTAVFCFNDTVAAGVLARMNAKGGKAAALSVIGCGDDAVAQQVHPLLTTIRIPAEEMGQQGVKEIEARVQAEDLIETRKTVLPVRLVERDSCKPAKI
jgi:DNA-binding LacI/PurR family transcriptional regulator